MIDMKTAIVAVLAVMSMNAGQSDRERTEARALLREGQAALEVERWDEAERAFRGALRLDASLDLAHYGLGQVHMATRRYPRAVEAFSSSRDVFMRNASEAVSNRLEGQQKLDDRIQELKDFIRGIETGRIRSQNSAGSVQQYRTQLTQLEAMRRRDPAAAIQLPPYILTALGSAYFRAGAFADAEREWRAAIAIDPSIGEIHNNLAVVLMLTNRFDEADKEVALAEKAGFKVNPRLKEDLRSKRAK
jgi:tetratricopeptide (TPR) repeat protein